MFSVFTKTLSISKLTNLGALPVGIKLILILVKADFSLIENLSGYLSIRIPRIENHHSHINSNISRQLKRSQRFRFIVLNLQEKLIFRAF